MPVRTAICTVVDIPAAKQFVDLAMGDDRLPDGSGTPHGPLHEFVGLHAAPIVRKSDDLRCQSSEVDQLTGTALPDSDTPVRINPHSSVAPNSIELQSQRLGRIGRRV